MDDFFVLAQLQRAVETAKKTLDGLDINARDADSEQLRGYFARSYGEALGQLIELSKQSRERQEKSQPSGATLRPTQEPHV